ncbi:MAG: GIY-YIG nuclease family protein [Thermanaerothrix sp.]|nr:GIY-YIG nuclease family protein [Thermanaerothrix sp.]
MTLTLPAVPGIYGLILWLPHTSHVRIGRLGTYDFSAGWYAYWGSARGPGGIAARIHHHLNPTVRPHWHLDFLRPYGQIKAVLFTPYPAYPECQWVQQALTFPNVTAPVQGFGSRDCRKKCPSHLLYFGTHLDLNDLAAHINAPIMICLD